MSDTTRTTAEKPRIEKTRSQFRSLIAANPNYFGNFEVAPFELVEKIASNTTYEELTTLGYNPRTKILFSTFDVKQPLGYGGDLCDDGTTEYVRFYADFGSGWQDAGSGAIDVHDIPTDTDCANKDTHPLSYTFEVDYAPPRKWCSVAQLPRIRAILSWNMEPPAGSPGWVPVYGNVLECHIQIDKSWWWGDLFDVLKPNLELPPSLLKSIEPLETVPDPESLFPGPVPDPPFKPVALTVAELAQRYIEPVGKRDAFVAPSRFAFAEYQALKVGSGAGVGAFESLTTALEAYDIDLKQLVESIEETSGNTSYEELADVGLDWNQEKLTATYKVKQPGGFSGGLCTEGSTEYVVFWADFEDTCKWSYLGTVDVKVYDFDDLDETTDGVLCYTAALPVDLSKVRRDCEEPRVGRIRAVLSWNAPPSTTDPDAVPYWGNRLDAHVLIPPGDPIVGVQPVLTAVGGIGVPYISDVTGLTNASAKFVNNGLSADSLGRPCPFGGRIVVRGPGFVGHKYRVQTREVGSATWSTLDSKIWVTNTSGFGAWHYPHSGGWFNYLPFSSNFAGVLAYFASSGDEQWDIRLEILGVAGGAVQRVQLDNTGPTVDVWITQPVGDCGLLNPGDVLEGRAVATDSYLRSWSVSVDGGPGGFGPEPAVTAASATSDTPLGGAQWSYDTTGLVQCGYVVKVSASDRAIVNSSYNGHHRSDDVGFCLLE